MILPYLDERQRRLLLGAAARSMGRGGIAAVARASGVSRPTITAGLRELERSTTPAERVRRPAAEAACRGQPRVKDNQQGMNR